MDGVTLDPRTAQRMGRATQVVEKSGPPPVPGRRGPRSSGTTDAPIKVGLAVSGTAATWQSASQTMVVGTITVRELVTVPAFDNSQSYVEGDVAQDSGLVYRCGSGGWLPGDPFPGVWAEVSPTPDVVLSSATVDLPYYFPDDVVGGELVKWRANDLVVITCDAIEGYA